MNVNSEPMNAQRGEKSSERVSAERLRKAAILGLLLLLPLSAQQNQNPPLSGRVSQDEIINPRYKTTVENEMHISQLVGDIIQQVDLIIPSYHSEPSPMPALNADVTEYDKYKASKKYGEVAQKYSSCVDKALEAAPHLKKAAEAEVEYNQLRIQQRGQSSPELTALLKTEEREAKIGKDLHKAAAECLDNTADPNNLYGQFPGLASRRIPLRANSTLTNNGTSYYPTTQTPTTQAPSTNCLDSATQRQIGPQEALRTFAAMGSQADIVITTMGQLSVARLAYLAQPNAVNNSLTAGAKAVVDYVSSDDARANANVKLMEGAQAGVDQARKNPAALVGAVGTNALWAALQGGVTKVCEATPSALTKLKADLAAAQTSVSRLQQLATEENVTPPPATGTCVTVNPPPPGGLRDCFPTSVAYDLTRETGYRWHPNNFNWNQADVGPTWTQVGAALRAV
jgi:hypothetical protein